MSTSINIIAALSGALFISTASALPVAEQKVYEQICGQVPNIIATQDVEAFKRLSIPVPLEEDKYQQYLARQHRKYMVKSGSGFDKFQMIKLRVFKNAKNADNYTVQRSAQRFGHNTEVWLEVRIETKEPDSGKNKVRHTRCKFGDYDNQWRLINLLG